MRVHFGTKSSKRSLKRVKKRQRFNITQTVTEALSNQVKAYVLQRDTLFTRAIAENIII